jgi:thiamine biosynthesis lipoprotein
MNSYSNSLSVERAQPWLGTLVSIRIEGLPVPQAHRAIDAAFKEIAVVHRRMSFHDADSDVGQLNRNRTRRPVTVHPYTFEVLQWAMRLSSFSNGCFDISVAAELVDWQLLPRPAGAEHVPRGSWRDIELLPDCQVVFHRPLWIDLGGIAKGFAVDRATERLRACGALHTVVNAGGDIRVQGKSAAMIRLGAESSTHAMPVLELADGSVAGSSSQRQWRCDAGLPCSPHVDGIQRSPAPTDRFVCVVAKQCVVADALTKVVMAQGQDSVRTLRQFGASAHLYASPGVWRHLEPDERGAETE